MAATRSIARGDFPRGPTAAALCLPSSPICSSPSGSNPIWVIHFVFQHSSTKPTERHFTLMTLQQFLLKEHGSRSNWLWIPSLVPQPQEHYSWLRVLGFVVLRTVRAYLVVRLLLTLFWVFERENQETVGSVIAVPHGEWLALVFAEFVGLRALVLGLLSRAAWNRRADELVESADPGAPVPESGGRLPYLSILIYSILVTFVTPLLMFHAIEDVRGWAALRAEKSKLIAAGECLEISCLLGPPPPNEENFFSTPFWKQFEYRRVPTTNPGGLEIHWTFKQGEIFPYHTNLSLPELREADKEEKGNSTSRRATDGRIHLSDWANTLRESTTNTAQLPQGRHHLDFPLPAQPGKPAEDVLLGLSKFDATLAEFAAAARRPRSVYPVHYEESFNALLPHLSCMKGIARIYQVRAFARMETGDSQRAAEDVQMIFRISDALQEDPLLISQLVRIAVETIACKTLWQGLVDHRWTDSQLMEFQRFLSHRALGPSLIHGLKGERIMGITGTEQALLGPFKLLVDTGFLDRVGNTEETGLAPNVFSAAHLTSFLIPVGWVRKSQVELLRGFEPLLTTARTELNSTNRTVLWSSSPGSDAASTRDRSWGGFPFTVLSRMLLPALENAAHKANFGQTMIGLAGAACALERYHLAKGEFPVSLSELVPQYVAAVPIDWMNGEPLHYRRTDDGWYQLWSVGQDGKDDGGVFREWIGKGANTTGPELDIPWPRPVLSTEKRIF